MSKDIHPTYDEDISLARTGRIRTPDGIVKEVGRKEAYRIIDERDRSNFYHSSRVDYSKINWKKRSEPQPVVENEEHDAKLPKEPNGIPERGNGADPGEPKPESQYQPQPESQSELEPQPDEPVGQATDDKPVPQPEPSSTEPPASGFVRGRTTVSSSGKTPRRIRAAKD